MTIGILWAQLNSSDATVISVSKLKFASGLTAGPQLLYICFSRGFDCNLNIMSKIPTYILLIVLLLVGCIDLSWKPPDPGTVMAELSNPEKSLSARVIATKVQGTYIFEVRSIKNSNVLEKKTISAPIGYHVHIVSLTWNNDGQTATATIDHDFGEGNKVYDINILNNGF